MEKVEIMLKILYAAGKAEKERHDAPLPLLSVRGKT